MDKNLTLQYTAQDTLVISLTKQKRNRKEFEEKKSHIRKMASLILPKKSWQPWAAMLGAEHCVATHDPLFLVMARKKAAQWRPAFHEI